MRLENELTQQNEVYYTVFGKNTNCLSKPFQTYNIHSIHCIHCIHFKKRILKNEK